MNSKVQISGKSKVLMLKCRIETHFRITNISCHLSSCSGPNYFKVLCKIVLPSKLIDKSIFWIAKTSVKTVKTTSTKTGPMEVLPGNQKVHLDKMSD